jgi:hypothetical protein
VVIAGVIVVALVVAAVIAGAAGSGSSSRKVLPFGATVTYHGAEISLTQTDRNGPNLFLYLTVVANRNGASCPAPSDVYAVYLSQHFDPTGQPLNIPYCTTLNKGDQGEAVNSFPMPSDAAFAQGVTLVLAPGRGPPVARWNVPGVGFATQPGQTLPPTTTSPPLTTSPPTSAFPTTTPTAPATTATVGILFKATSVPANCTAQALQQAAVQAGEPGPSDFQVPDSEFVCSGPYATAHLYSPSVSQQGGPSCAVGYFRNDSGVWSAYWTGDTGSVSAASLGMPESTKSDLDSKLAAIPSQQCGSH